MSPVCRRPVHWQCLLPAADHSHTYHYPPGPSGSFLTPPRNRDPHSRQQTGPPVRSLTLIKLCQRLSITAAALPRVSPSTRRHSSNIESNMEEKAPGATLCHTGLVCSQERAKKRAARRSRLFCFTQLAQKMSIKTQSNTSSAFGNLNIFWSDLTGGWNSFSVKLLNSNRPSAPAHSQQCDLLYVNMIFTICIYGCVWVLNIYMLIGLIMLNPMTGKDIYNISLNVNTVLTEVALYLKLCQICYL